MMLSFIKIDNEIIKFIESKDCVSHYTKKAIALEHILFDGIFKLNEFYKTNDPREYKEKLSGIYGISLGDKRLDRALKIKKRVDDIILNNTGFASYCMNTFYENMGIKTYGILKSRMWSQYGENHGGICIIFSRIELERIIKKIFVKEKYLTHADKVDYKEYFVGNGSYLKIKLDDIDKKDEYSNAFAYLENNYTDLLFVKQTDYRDEDEYRICVTRKTEINDSPLMFDIKKCIKAIILGDDFHDVYNNSVSGLGEKYRVPVLKLNWRHEEYILSNIR
jgi:hypothetical protein